MLLIWGVLSLLWYPTFVWQWFWLLETFLSGFRYFIIEYIESGWQSFTVSSRVSILNSLNKGFANLHLSFQGIIHITIFFLIWWHHLLASFGFAHKFDNHISSESKWALQIVFSNSFEFQYLNIHRRSFALINVIFNMVSWTVHVRYSSSIRPRWTCVEICFYWSLIQRQFFCVIFFPIDQKILISVLSK